MRSPQRQPFELRAEREVALETQLPVSLASLPEAGSQQGTIVIAAAGDVPLSVTNRRFEPIEPDTSAEADVLIDALFVSLRARTRNQFRLSARAGAVALGRRFPASRRRGVELAVRFMRRAQWPRAAPGLFEIQNAGRGRCRLTLPEGAELLGLWLGRDPQPVSSEGRKLAVSLPPAQKFSTITVQFTTSGPAWGLWRRWTAPTVEIDLPVLARHETLWFPASYQAIGSRATGSARPHDWAERLFGLLARPARRSHLILRKQMTGSIWSRGSAEVEALHHADQLLRRLGQTAIRLLSTGETRPSWSGLVEELISKPPAGSLPLLVDRRALADQDIWPTTTAPSLPASMAGEETLTIAVRILQQGNLALIADPQAILLTSLPLATRGRNQLQPTGDWPVFLSTEGPLRRQIEAGLIQDSNRFVQLPAWKSTLRPPWGDAGPSEAQITLAGSPIDSKLGICRAL